MSPKKQRMAPTLRRMLGCIHKIVLWMRLNRVLPLLSAPFSYLNRDVEWSEVFSACSASPTWQKVREPLGLCGPPDVAWNLLIVTQALRTEGTFWWLQGLVPTANLRTPIPNLLNHRTLPVLLSTLEGWAKFLSWFSCCSFFNRVFCASANQPF